MRFLRQHILCRLSDFDKSRAGTSVEAATFSQFRVLHASAHVSVLESAIVFLD